MAFQIPSDVFIWRWCYKPSASPPRPADDDLLTPSNLGLPCVFKYSHVFVAVIDWESVCVCASSPVCQLVYLCV